MSHDKPVARIAPIEGDKRFQGMARTVLSTDCEQSQPFRLLTGRATSCIHDERDDDTSKIAPILAHMNTMLHATWV